MKKLSLSLTLVLSLFSGINIVLGEQLQASKPNSMENIFPIGVWCDGRVEGINGPKGFGNVPFGLEKARTYYEKIFKDIKSHGIDIIVIPNTPPQYRLTLLSAADEVGVKIVLELVELADVKSGSNLSVGDPNLIKDKTVLRERLGDLIAPLKTHPSLFCYQIFDEPPLFLADKFQKEAEILAELDPLHPVFSCLCNENELPRTSAMGTQMIVFDRYPIVHTLKPGDYDFHSYFTLLEELRYHSDRNNIPYWMAVQALSKPDVWRFPTAAELRVLTYLPLSRNCKGIFFFLYNSMTQEEKMQGLVDAQHRPTHLWPVVEKIAGELKRLEPVILDIKPIPIFAGTKDPRIDVQSFEDSKKQKYLFISNLDVLENKTAVIQFKSECKPRKIHNLVNETALHLDKLADNTLSIKITLEAGECAILHFGE